MSKPSILFASFLALSALSSTAAFAAPMAARASDSQGEAYNQCRQEVAPQHGEHGHQAIEACVQRLEHRGPSTY